MTKLISKDLTEDFWNDCNNSKLDTKLEILFPYKNFSKTLGRNSYREKIKNKNKYLLKLYSFQYQNPSRKKNPLIISSTKNKSQENSKFCQVYKKHPLLHERNLNSQESKEIKQKQKNALLRCLGLYAYGVEVKKEKILNDENNKKEKMKNEILPCTFKPKISKYSSKKKSVFLTDAMNKNKIKNKKIDKNNLNDLNAECKASPLSTYDNGGIKKDIMRNNNNKNVLTHENNEISEKNDECTFKPKIIRRNIYKIFSLSKSLANEKDNDQFFTRYNKAREDYMTKKIKKLSTKDESYNTMLKLYNNCTNKNQKNKTVKYSINGYKIIDNGINYENKRMINIDPNIIKSLRNELLRIDLSDDL